MLPSTQRRRFSLWHTSIPWSSPQALANSLWSFANLRWYPVRLLEVITRAVGRKLHSMSPQEISNSIWAYAK